MKKGILLLLTMLLLVSTVEAKNGERANYKMGYMDIYDASPIQFTERGVKFYVFLDGEFDFSTRPHNYNNIDILYKSSRRSTRTRMNFDRGIRIERDYNGRIRRIGNVFINYSRYGKVKRIGNIFVDYHHGKLTKVGNLRVLYNHRGNVRYIGNVKRRFHHRNHYYYGNTWEYDYDDDFFYRDDFYNDYESYDEDDNYLYYRSKDLRKGGKEHLIKRKKEYNSKKNHHKNREKSRKRKHDD